MSNNSVRAELVRELTVRARLFQIASDKMDDSFNRLAGINATDGRCMDLLDVRGPMTAGELAAAANLSPGAVTTVLDRLELKDLVRRRRDEDDRRRVIAEPTEKARRLAGQVYGPIAAYARRFLDDMSDTELEVVIRFLDAAIAVNEQRAAEIAEG